MKKTLHATLPFLLFSVVSFAQNKIGFCGAIADTSWENEAFNIARNGDYAQKVTSTYYIPTVFHIIHHGGPENVSDTFVYSLLAELNNKFTNTAPFHDTDGTETGIRFCLAEKDTAGNPTTGITRDSTIASNMFTYHTIMGLPASYNVDSVIKKQFAWDTRHYYNIYLVENAYINSSGLAGYATYPWNHGNFKDGTVLDYDYVDPDDSIYHKADVIAHETGHYLGLYHTFEFGGCPNSNCSTGNDRVCDTPPDNNTNAFDTVCVSNSCNTDTDDTSYANPFRNIALGGLGDQNDDTRNFMDYTFCRSKFTPRQGVRMRASLTTIRNSLFDSAHNYCTILTPTPTSTNAPQKNDDAFTIAPNPFNEELIITTQYNRTYSVTLISMTGSVVCRRQLSRVANSIPLSNIPIGTYVYVLNDEHGILKTGKVVKQ